MIQLLAAVMIESEEKEIVYECKVRKSSRNTCHHVAIRRCSVLFFTFSQAAARLLTLRLHEPWGMHGPGTVGCTAVSF